MNRKLLTELGIFSGIFLVVYSLTCFSAVSRIFNFIGVIVLTIPIGLIAKIIIYHHTIKSSPSSRDKVKTTGRAVFITGCDTGFGHELAKRLSSDGFHVFAGCLFSEGESAQLLKKSQDGMVEILQCDVTENDQVLKCATSVSSSLKENNLELWAVINNAGIATFCEFEWVPMSVYEKILDINSLGAVRVIKAFLPLLRCSMGRIVIVASLAGRYAIPYFTGYSMSKHAQIALADGLRRELRKFGVKVSLIEPGMYKTAMANTEVGLREVAGYWEQGTEEVKSFYGVDYYERFQKHLVSMSEKCNPHVHEVVDLMEEAVTSLNPQKRYVPGFNSSFIRGHFLPCLPYLIQDFVFAKLALKRNVE